VVLGSGCWAAQASAGVYWANATGGIGQANLDASDPATVASPFIPSADTSTPYGIALDAGEIELVSCKPVTKGKGKHKQSIQKCSTKLTSKPVRFMSARDVSSAVLSRGNAVYLAADKARRPARQRGPDRRRV
jgi:hypothetical protein